MQAASDIFLGYEQVKGPDGITRDYYLRQLRDWKGSYDIEGAIPLGLTKYVSVCSQALARAHARSGDPIAIASYLGNGTSFERALAEFASTYADQNERDYEALRQAASTGRISVQSGV
jgi:predicted alpha/beta hydrolase